MCDWMERTAQKTIWTSCTHCLTAPPHSPSQFPSPTTRNFPAPHASSSATIVEIIASTASRWKCLKVDKSSFEALKESFPGPLTVLKDLNLRFNVDLLGAPVDLFLGCSHLRRLSIIRNSLWRRDSLLRMPWHQLTDLQLVESDPALCHSILLQCKNLMWARITTSHWDTVDAYAPTTSLPSDVDAPNITLPFLKLLKIRFEDDDSGEGSNDDSDDDDFCLVGPFFTPLCLPALRALELRFTYNTSWPAREFTAFQKRSPKITRISLENCRITSQQLVSVLRRTPSLTAFSLDSCFNCIDNESLQALSGENHPRPLVPRLQEIDWREIGRYYDPAVFEAAITSRCSTDGTAPLDVAKLKKMTITKASFAPDPFDWLRTLVEHGLKLNII
ncbi:hypothetical protein MVEN_00821500 [Mycena venus]|uniref:Uncharacterized protein n=1 Tax=Mycena venus TaxID=2733690 RepID=A0A8H6YGA7_9AGAR|nr:hypothetical protein MVEN_00821500 [Mycena venus]